MSVIITKHGGSEILSSVPPEHAFYFYTDEGGYTGISANSLEDFVDKLEEIDESSILFHYPRGDFQAWIHDILKDSELADKMCFIKRDISGEKLRYQLIVMVKTRIKELKEREEKFPPSLCNAEGLCLS